MNYADMDLPCSTSTPPEEDVRIRLKVAWQSNAPIGIDMRFLLMDAHDEIQRLDNALLNLRRPWWRFW